MTEQEKRQAEFIGKRFPETAEATIRAAEDALRGVMVLPGNALPSRVGIPPAWTYNPYGHNEYTFHLNRMNHWLPLLRAYALTGDMKYAGKVTEELENWIETCPRPSLDDKQSFDCLSPWRSLEAGIRMHKTWYFVPRYLEGLPCFEAVKDKFYHSVEEHAEALSVICPQLWPNADHNHYLMEMLGLLAASEMLENEAYRRQAINELERCAQNQITPEGGQIEGCPSYHNGCVYWFTRALALSDGFSEEYKERVRKMPDYSLYTFRPSGTTVPWGDSTAKRGALRSAVLGYTAFGNAEHLRLLVKLLGKDAVYNAISSMAWEITDAEGLLDALGGDTHILPVFAVFPTLKQAAMRTDWGSGALSVFFACRVPIWNAHAHIDAMGFDFTAYGKPMVVDAGKYTYKEGEQRYLFKSAAWHNTATVNERDHFEYISSWKYGEQGQGDILEFTGDSVTAEHNCFAPCIHKRKLELKPDRLAVDDCFDGCAADTKIQIYFHLDYENVKLDKEKGVAFSVGEAPSVRIYFDKSLSADLLPGEVSDINDVSRPSVRLRLNSDSGEGTRRFRTVIVPNREEQSSEE